MLLFFIQIEKIVQWRLKVEILLKYFMLFKPYATLTECFQPIEVSDFLAEFIKVVQKNSLNETAELLIQLSFVLGHEINLVQVHLV